MKTGYAETNIFKSNSQFLHQLDPALIRPIIDRVLVKDCPDPEKIGSIFIPATAAERGLGKDGLLRMGIVVAVGPGDPYSKEWVERDNMTGKHQVMRKALGACQTCGDPFPELGASVGIGYVRASGDKMDKFRFQEGPELGEPTAIPCPDCKGDGIRRWPMYCKVGDRVIVDRRKESEFYVNGERFYLCHEQQAILAILES